MASFASSATTCGARKHAWTKRKKKVGENNGQLRFRPPPRVAHASRLDQFLTNIFVFLGKFPYNFDYI